MTNYAFVARAGHSPAVIMPPLSAKSRLDMDSNSGSDLYYSNDGADGSRSMSGYESALCYPFPLGLTMRIFDRIPF